MLLDAVAQATAQRRIAFSKLDPAGLATVFQDPSSPQASRMIARIDMPRMLAAADALIRTVDILRPRLRTLRATAASCPIPGLLCIGSEGDDRWTQDAQIIIDPAGDDTYLNNAGGTLSGVAFAAAGGCVFGGGTTGRATPNLGCAAAPGWVCTYDSANRATGRDDLPRVGVPGHRDPGEGDADSGSCGNDDRLAGLREAAMGLGADPDGRSVALLLDLDGSDTYLAAWQHEDPVFGLIDECYPGEGDRVNTNRDFIQGASLAGIGIAWDDGTGDDVYRARLNSQGSGHVGGVGALITTGRGDATFWADRLSQGNGIGGGIGILANLKDGTQTYLLDPPLVFNNEFAPNARGCQQEGRAGQGEGGFGGVGVLATLGGRSSTYRAVTHLTNEAHPFAPVLDANGSPRLVPGTDAQGSGESFPLAATGGGIVLGIGLLIDRTNGDARTCPSHPRAGMLRGSTTSTGEDLSTIGVPDRDCGAFNLRSELDPVGSLDQAITHLIGGAVGIRVVLP